MLELLSVTSLCTSVDLRDNLLQSHAALAKRLAIEINAGHCHDFTLLHFILEQGTVDRRMLDPWIEDAHQVQRLDHVRTVLARQREVGFKLKVAVQVFDLFNHFLAGLGRMTTYLQQRQNKGGKFMAHGDAGESHADVAANTINGK